MRKLRYCKRCNEIFEALGKYSRICDSCRLNKTIGGWNLGNEKIKSTILSKKAVNND